MKTTYTLNFYANWSIVAKENKNHKIYYQDNLLIFGVLELIQFAELLKASAGNRLIRDKIYEISNIKAQITSKKGNFYLNISNHSINIYLDKYEASYFARIIDKIVNKIDLPTNKETLF